MALQNFYSSLSDLSKKGSALHNCNEQCDKLFQKLNDAITSALELLAKN